MQPVSVDLEKPAPDPRENLRRLARSHRRWSLLFAGFGVSGLAGFVCLSTGAAQGAHVARLWSLGLGAFFALNALTSVVKHRVLRARLRAAERTAPQLSSDGPPHGRGPGS